MRAFQQAQECPITRLTPAKFPQPTLRTPSKNPPNSPLSVHPTLPVPVPRPPALFAPPPPPPLLPPSFYTPFPPLKKISKISENFVEIL